MQQRRLPPRKSKGGVLVSPERGWMYMVSYEALIQIFMLVVDVLTLTVMTIALFKKN